MATKEDLHRANGQLKAEISAINKYNIDIKNITDPSLKKVLIYNRNEELDHAAVLRTWILENV